MNATPDQDIVAPRYRSASEQLEEALSVMLERALDMLDCALLIVDHEGRVRYRNRVAVAFLKGDRGALNLQHKAVREAIRLACQQLQPSGVCLSHAGAASERWLRLVVAPIYFGGGGASHAAIWVLNTASPGLPSEEVLAALFGLSRAEARLAIGLLRGRSAAEYARLAGVGVATIRSQLHSIFVKTGVKRQAQLVALLARVPALQIFR
jgi:DNA-binding CsgD family transcriptional regulator